MTGEFVCHGILFASMRIYAAWTKMSTFSPDISHSLKDIFNNTDKIPAVANTDKGDVKATEEHLVSPELIAYLKCLIIETR